MTPLGLISAVLVGALCGLPIAAIVWLASATLSGDARADDVVDFSRPHTLRKGAEVCRFIETATRPGEGCWRTTSAMSVAVKSAVPGATAPRYLLVLPGKRPVSVWAAQSDVTN